MKFQTRTIAILAAVWLTIAATTAQVTIGSDQNPNADALLDLTEGATTKKGLLLPRVALTSVDAFAPLSAHVAGMVVYNTATAGTGANAVKPGFYVSDGTKWVPMGEAQAGFKSSALTGTTSTEAEGTVVYNTATGNGVTPGFYVSRGGVWVPSESPSEFKSTALSGTSTTQPSGTIVYNTANGNGVTPGFYVSDGTSWKPMNAAQEGFKTTALTAANSPAPLTAHTAGTVVYNTATAGTPPNDVTPGFYVNDGTKWVPMGASQEGIKTSALTATNVAATPGTLVYNTNTTTGANGVSPGFYVNDGAKWVAAGVTPWLQPVATRTQAHNVYATGNDSVMATAARVTIGLKDSLAHKFSALEIVSTTGGLRLPQLNKAQRDALTLSLGTAAADGLAIFNTDNDCVEYWRANQWISLCEGASRMTIIPEPHKVKIDSVGNMTYPPHTSYNDTIEYSMVDDPDVPNGPFAFTVMLGNEYASLSTEEYGDWGLFELIFTENNSTHRRNAIVRITNISTGKYIDALYTQEGWGCTPMYAPNIETVPASTIGTGRSIAFCASGAVYLYADTTTNSFNRANLDQLIWTRNGVEIARGVTSITATQAGVYDISMGLIGCNAKTNNAVTITRNGDSTAPMSVTILVTGNNGTVCDESGTAPYGTAQLTARKAGTNGTVRWFRNGKLQAVTGNVIQAGIGTWFAVVEDGGCYSTPSEKIDVTLDPNAGSNLTTPSMDLGTGDFCAGSTRTFSVSNAAAGVTYVWYANNEQIGVGEKIQYVVPASASQIIIRCRATQPGSCAAEASDDKAVSTGTIPPMPAIGGSKVLCSGEATLSILPATAGTYNYAWYKDGELKASTQTYKITEGGDYYATVTPQATGSCTSPMAHINIPKVSSALPVVSLNASTSKTDTIIVDSKLTFVASLQPGTAIDYKWTITNATLLSGGKQGDGFAVVEFRTHTVNATVSVEGFNDCGSSERTMDIYVKNACESISKVDIKGQQTKSVVKGFSSELEAVATFSGGNTAARTYQWYINTVNSNTGGNPIAGATSNIYVAPNDVVNAAPYYYYCVVAGTGGCTSVTRPSDRVYSIKVNDMPTPGLNAKGTFTGRVCYDINKSVPGNACGTTSSRQTTRADFSIRIPQDMASGAVKAPYSGVQVYTFKPEGAVSNVRFLFSDQLGLAIDSIVPQGDYSGNGISTPCRVTVYFKTTLQTYLEGKSRDYGLKPELFVIYNENSTNTGTDRSFKITTSLQDCSCCGAKTVGGGWQTFACYNLGVDPELGLDPYTYVVGTQGTGADGTLGWLYEWGRTDDGFGKDGYQRRNSRSVVDRAGQGNFLNPTNPGHTNFIFNDKKSQGQDWTMGGSENAGVLNDRWGNGTQDADVPKAKNDPCPQGWKVPSQKQWASILQGQSNNEKLTVNGSTAVKTSASGNEWKLIPGKGYMVGESLFLPFGGYRSNVDGALSSVGQMGLYWSSTVVPNSRFAYPFRLSPDDIQSKREVTARANGASVRCVPE